MNIAVIGSFSSPAPYTPGKIHAPIKLTYQLARGLAEKGHKIYFYGRVNENFQSHPNIIVEDYGYAALPSFESKGSEEITTVLKLLYEQGYISKIFAPENINRFDLIYSWAGYRVAEFAKLCQKPVVLTHHDSTNLDKYRFIFDANSSSNLWMIPISEKMKRDLPFAQNLDVVYNGVDPDEITPRESEDYFCWIGRVVPSKGLHTALQLCSLMGFKLKIAGPMAESNSDFGETADYIKSIKKQLELLDDKAEYLGVLAPQDALNLLSASKGLIFPSDGNEGCPMVVLESMMAGVPVITSDKGPMPELVEEGVTGYLCPDIEVMKEAIKSTENFDRAACRQAAIDRFSIHKMVEGYEKAFLQLTK